MLRNILLSSVVLAGVASAQCSNLSASNNAGDVTLAMSGGAAMSPTFMLVGQTTGTTPISIGNLGSVTLGLAMPFVPAPAGLSDMNGDASLTFTVPSVVTGTYYFQALTISFSFNPGSGTPGNPGAGFGLDFCESNVASLTF
ncbi:MAG TPA: hypothetical protein ENI87_03815 [bacterium]|nr:hypothetical protein [bacterium]